MASKVTQINDYFPFGLQFPKACGVGVVPENRYRYNGIEHIEELELDMAAFRSYDAAIGRWMQVNPLAEKYYSMSPYNGMGNNPISIADPLGDTLWIITSYGDMKDSGGNAIVNEMGEVIAGNGHTRVAYTPGMKGNGNGKFVDEIVEVLNYIYSNISAEAINSISESPENSTIVPYRQTKYGGVNAYYFDDNRDGTGGSYLMGDLSLGMEFHTSTATPNFLQYWFGEWGYRSPAESIFHELQHNAGYFSDPVEHTRLSQTPIARYGKAEEKRVIDIENAAARKLYGDQAKIRTHHGGQMTKRKNGLFPN